MSTTDLPGDAETASVTESDVLAVAEVVILHQSQDVHNIFWILIQLSSQRWMNDTAPPGVQRSLMIGLTGLSGTCVVVMMSKLIS